MHYRSKVYNYNNLEKSVSSLFITLSRILREPKFLIINRSFVRSENNFAEDCKTFCELIQYLKVEVGVVVCIFIGIASNCKKNRTEDLPKTKSYLVNLF